MKGVIFYEGAVYLGIKNPNIRRGGGITKALELRHRTKAYTRTGLEEDRELCNNSKDIFEKFKISRLYSIVI